MGTERKNRKGMLTNISIRRPTMNRRLTTCLCPRPSVALIAVVAIGLVVTIGLGVYPAPLLELVEGASAAILPGG